jgi:hypothetical protein
VRVQTRHEARGETLVILNSKSNAESILFFFFYYFSWEMRAHESLLFQSLSICQLIE